MLADVLQPAPVQDRQLLHTGMVWNLVAEEADLGPAGTVRREFLEHTGAVGILAMDQHDNVLLLRQYRHPVGFHLWELPAGLLDVTGEPPQACAARELAEEADLTAEQWWVLADWWNSPGGSQEAFRLFLARGLGAVPPAERHQRTHEEQGMPVVWVPLSDAVNAVLAGRLGSPTAVAGLLAAWAARQRNWDTLRPADAPWPQHPRMRASTSGPAPDGGRGETGQADVSKWDSTP
ncbi:MAG: ADP-ribose pyrophosphatase [Micrococcales bacterium]|nr:MAG: ADP-ribose pyrophosphatase [Micrococcales bacterium]